MLSDRFLLHPPPFPWYWPGRARGNSTKSSSDGIVSSLSYLFPNNVLPRGYGSGNMLERIKAKPRLVLLRLMDCHEGIGSGDPLTRIICCLVLSCHLYLFSLSLYLSISLSLYLSNSLSSYLSIYLSLSLYPSLLFFYSK